MLRMTRDYFLSIDLVYFDPFGPFNFDIKSHSNVYQPKTKCKNAMFGPL